MAVDARCSTVQLAVGTTRSERRSCAAARKGLCFTGTFTGGSATVPAAFSSTGRKRRGSSAAGIGLSCGPSTTTSAGLAGDCHSVAVVRIFSSTLGVSRAVLFPAIVPAVSVLVGIPIVGEIPGPLQIAGLVLVTLGLLITIGMVRRLRFWR